MQSWLANSLGVSGGCQMAEGLKCMPVSLVKKILDTHLHETRWICTLMVNLQQEKLAIPEGLEPSTS